MLVTDRKPNFVRDYPFLADPRYHFVLLYDSKGKLNSFASNAPYNVFSQIALANLESFMDPNWTLQKLS